MSDEQPGQPIHDPASQQGEDGLDLVAQALDHLRAGLSGNESSSWPPALALQKACLAEWAESLGLLLDPQDIPAKSVRGGQEHDFWHDDVEIHDFQIEFNREAA